MKCVYCDCIFETQHDLTKHLTRFGDEPHQIAVWYRHIFVERDEAEYYFRKMTEYERKLWRMINK